MGLDVSHDCWHGAYSAFGRWREEIAEICGIPLRLMNGFYAGPCEFDDEVKAAPCLHNWAKRTDEWLPIEWASLRPDAIHMLLNHSDCDGMIRWEDCRDIARRLEQILPNLPEDADPGHIGNWRDTTQRFVDGLMRAWEAEEDVEFH